MRIRALLSGVVVLGLAIAPRIVAADPGGPDCCARCGCHAACVQKTCQLVCGVKKETKSYWCVECSEFCTLMPGRRDCCECGQPEPRCGHSKCVKKLVKKEYQVEVPVYKCVVAYVCPTCAKGPSSGSVTVPAAPTPPSIPLPPKPLPPAPKVKK